MLDPAARAGTALERGRLTPEPAPRSNDAPAALRDAPAGCGLDLALLLLAGAALRIAAILTVGDTPRLRGDEVGYVRTALALARGEGFLGSPRPPGTALLLASGFWLGGPHVVMARLVQVPLSLLAVAAVWDLVRRRFGRGPAVASGLVVALNPTLIQYCHFLWPETLAAALLAGAVWCADRFDASGRTGWLAAVGALLGAAALTKEQLLYLVPVFAAWAWWIAGASSGRRRRGLAALALACATVIAPWTVHKSLTERRFVLISTARWAPIAYGLVSDRTGADGRARPITALRRALSELPPAEKEAAARAVAMHELEALTPRRLLGKLWYGPRMLFSTQSQLRRFANSGWLRRAWRRLAHPLVTVEIVFFVATIAAGIAGLWLVPFPRVKPLVVATTLLFVAVHTIAVSTGRYRVPLLPLLALPLGPLLFGAVARGRALVWRGTGAALCLVWFLAVVASATPSSPTRRSRKTLLPGAKSVHSAPAWTNGAETSRATAGAAAASDRGIAGTDLGA